MISHCEHFKPSPATPWLCAWWESEIDEPGIAYFCSRPAWEPRDCETQGLRFVGRADNDDDGEIE
jgi:hypothetical protein